MLENAFHYFGGVPKRLVIDNLKAAVARADWYDPEIHPKLQSFAAHYGTAFLPTKPYTPRHKGKVESGVKYVKNNALKGRTFSSLADENQFLLDWESPPRPGDRAGADQVGFDRQICDPFNPAKNTPSPHRTSEPVLLRFCKRHRSNRPCTPVSRLCRRRRAATSHI